MVDVPAALAVSTRITTSEHFLERDNWDTCLTQYVGLFLAGIY